MDPISPSEEPLDALGRLIRGERRELARVAREEGLSAEDAIDCVHDALCTFLRLANERRLPADDVPVGAFVAGIVRNAARNKRRLHHLARPHADIDTVDPGGDGPTTEALLARAEEHVRLKACVARLCDTQRAVVTLRLLEEQHGDDVAASLGLSRGYVDVLLHRAKAQLKSCMTEY